MYMTNTRECRSVTGRHSPCISRQGRWRHFPTWCALGPYQQYNSVPPSTLPAHSMLCSVLVIQPHNTKNYFWKQPTYLHFICLLIDSQKLTECMLPFWTYTNLHSYKATRMRYSKNSRIYLKNRAVYGKKASIYKVYSGGIQLVFCQNTNMWMLLLPTSRRTVGTTHWAVPTADGSVMNVC